MKATRYIRALAWALFIAAAIFLAAIYADLPDRVATHYNERGEPDAWGDKGAFALLTLGAFGGLNLLLLVLVPLLMHILPPSLMNFPTRRMRDYWTATPQRFAAARARVANLVFACAVPIDFIFLLIVQVTYQRFVPDPAVRVPFTLLMWGATTLTLAIALIGSVWLCWSFRVPRDASI